MWFWIRSDHSAKLWLSSLPCEAEANQMAFSWLVPPCDKFFGYQLSASVILGSVNYSINVSAISFVYCWTWADLALLSFISVRNPIKNKVPEENKTEAEAQLRHSLTVGSGQAFPWSCSLLQQELPCTACLSSSAPTKKNVFRCNISIYTMLPDIFFMQSCVQLLQHHCQKGFMVSWVYKSCP